MKKKNKKTKRDEWETLNRGWKLIRKEMRYGIVYGITNICVPDQPPYTCVVPCLPLQQDVNSEGFWDLEFWDLYLSVLCFYIVSSSWCIFKKWGAKWFFLCRWRIFLCSEGFCFFLIWYIRKFHLVGKRNLTCCFK